MCAQQNTKYQGNEQKLHLQSFHFDTPIRFGKLKTPRREEKSSDMISTRGKPARQTSNVRLMEHQDALQKFPKGEQVSPNLHKQKSGHPHGSIPLGLRLGISPASYNCPDVVIKALK